MSRPVTRCRTTGVDLALSALQPRLIRRVLCTTSISLTSAMEQNLKADDSDSVRRDPTSVSPRKTEEQLKKCKKTKCFSYS
jgi:hypothetical protein